MSKTKPLPEAKDVDYRLEDGFMVIPSGSTDGLNYHVNEECCPCPAYGVCWHMKFRRKVRDDIVKGMIDAGMFPETIRAEQGANFPELWDMPQDYWPSGPYEQQTACAECVEADLTRKLTADKEKVAALDALYEAERSGWALSGIWMQSYGQYSGYYKCSLKQTIRKRISLTKTADGLGTTMERAILDAYKNAMEEDADPAAI